MWVEFWFESNAVVKLVTNAAEWQFVRDKYVVFYNADVYRCRCSMFQREGDGGLRCFGQRWEHRGYESLGEFFNRHGMTRV